MKADQIREKAQKVEGHLKSVEIPEWKCKIYFTPLTVADQQYIRQKFKGLIDDDLAIAVEAIFFKACDEDGERIWSKDEHREFLRSKVNEKILTRLTLAIGGASIEDSKKNL